MKGQGFLYNFFGKNMIDEKRIAVLHSPKGKQWIYIDMSMQIYNFKAKFRAVHIAGNGFGRQDPRSIYLSRESHSQLLDKPGYTQGP